MGQFYGSRISQSYFIRRIRRDLACRMHSTEAMAEAKNKAPVLSAGMSTCVCGSQTPYGRTAPRFNSISYSALHIDIDTMQRDVDIVVFERCTPT